MGHGMGNYDDINSMTKDLGLSEGQADKIFKIDSMYRALYFENRGNFERIDYLREQHRRAIEIVLNDLQRQKFSNVYDGHWKNWDRSSRYQNMGDYYGEGYGIGYGSGLYSSSAYMRQKLAIDKSVANMISGVDNKYREMYNSNIGNYNMIEILRLQHRSEIENILLNSEQRKIFSQDYENRWRGWEPGSRLGN